MSVKKSYLVSYTSRLKRDKERVQCPGCEKLVMPKCFEKHAKTCLKLDPRSQCVWCLGKEHWRRGKKGQHEDHLLKCWKTCPFRKATVAAAASTMAGTVVPMTAAVPSSEKVYLFSEDYNTDVVMSEYEECDLKWHDPDHVMCSERDMFGRSRLPDVPDQAYELFQVLELSPSSVVNLFANKNLNLAASYIRQYFSMLDTHQFFHCMVRGVALRRFLEVVQGSPFRMLPFSCLCDGGKYTEARHRQHRHFVIAYPKGRFEKEIWNRVTIPKSDKPEKDYKCHVLKEIKSPEHLANTIKYLSQRVSRCKNTASFKKEAEKSDTYFRKQFEKDLGIEKPDALFDFNDDDDDDDDRFNFCSEGGGDYEYDSMEAGVSSKEGHNLNHFYIFTSLPMNCKTALYMQWDGGLMDLICQQYSFTPPAKLVIDSLRRVNGRWRIPVKDLPKVELNEVLGVAKHWRPSLMSHGGNGDLSIRGQTLYLVDGWVLQFERDESLVELDFDEWLRVQAQCGNRVLGSVEKDLWTLNRYQQKCFNAIEEYHWKWQDEKAKREMDREKYETEMERSKKIVLEKDNEIALLKRALLEKDNENVSLKRVLLERDNENALLKRENESLKRTLLERDNEHLVKENTWLKMRLEEMKTEIASLKKALVRKDMEMIKYYEQMKREFLKSV